MVAASYLPTFPLNIKKRILKIHVKTMEKMTVFRGNSAESRGRDVDLYTKKGVFRLLARHLCFALPSFYLVDRQTTEVRH